MPPTKPSVSPIVEKIKSVWFSGTKPSAVYVPFTNMPVPPNPPFPMAIIELRAW